MRSSNASRILVLGSAAVCCGLPAAAQPQGESAQGTVILAAFPAPGLELARLNHLFDAARLRFQALPPPGDIGSPGTLRPFPLSSDGRDGPFQKLKGERGRRQAHPFRTAPHRTPAEPVPIPKETPADYRRTFRILLADPRKTDRYDRLLLKWAGQFGLDARLLKAIMAAESEFSPRALSPSGARGLMQVMPLTSEGLGVARERLWDPEQNIRAGAAYLAKLYSIAWRRFKLKGVSFRDAPPWILERVVAAYNAGPRAFSQKRWCRQTRDYVRKVMLYHRSRVAELRETGRTLRDWLAERAEVLLALRD